MEEYEIYGNSIYGHTTLKSIALTPYAITNFPRAIIGNGPITWVDSNFNPSTPDVGVQAHSGCRCRIRRIAPITNLGGDKFFHEKDSSKGFTFIRDHHCGGHSLSTISAISIYFFQCNSLKNLIPMAVNQKGPFSMKGNWAGENNCRAVAMQKNITSRPQGVRQFRSLHQTNATAQDLAIESITIQLNSNEPNHLEKINRPLLQTRDGFPI